MTSNVPAFNVDIVGALSAKLLLAPGGSVRVNVFSEEGFLYLPSCLTRLGPGST
jgi:hypothetical protein